jgi:hypothetical protein
VAHNYATHKHLDVQALLAKNYTVPKRDLAIPAGPREWQAATRACRPARFDQMTVRWRYSHRI